MQCWHDIAPHNFALLPFKFRAFWQFISAVDRRYDLQLSNNFFFDDISIDGEVMAELKKRLVDAVRSSESISNVSKELKD